MILGATGIRKSQLSFVTTFHADQRAFSDKRPVSNFAACDAVSIGTREELFMLLAQAAKLRFMPALSSATRQ